jgi:cell division septum initiation protein DivIVA
VTTHPRPPSSVPAQPAADPLQPVRRALLAAARTDATRLLADADAEAAATVARAEAEADRVRSLARTQGEADAEAALTAERARARRRARALVLAAQREALEELRAEVARVLPELRAAPGYAAWRDAAADEVRAILGEGAVVSEHPDGGVVGETPGRRVTVTLTALADEALAALGTDVEGLWSP